eukprot:SAG11_NODE_100_length_16863_cov_12.374911_5_plen_189_part_00
MHNFAVWPWGKNMGNACAACDSNSANVPQYQSVLQPTMARGQPDQLLALLDKVHLGQFHTALTQDYGITSAEQLKYLDDADLDRMGMRKVHKKAVAELMAAGQLEEDKTEKDALPTSEQPTAAVSHQGSTTVQQPHSAGQPAEKSKGAKYFGGNKHAILSYQWDCQKQVVEVRDLLQERGVPTWMGTR